MRRFGGLCVACFVGLLGACNSPSSGGGTGGMPCTESTATPAAPPATGSGATTGIAPRAVAPLVDSGTAPVPAAEVARDAVPALRCGEPVSIRPVGPLPTGPALQWLGETVIDGKTMETWDGATLKQHVDAPKAAPPKSAAPELATDDRGRVVVAATRAPVASAPLACGPASPVPGFDAGAPSYALSPGSGFETCSTAGRGLVVRHLASGTVTSLGEGRLTFSPDDLYAILEPMDRGPPALALPARTTIQKVTFDASGRAHTTAVADDIAAIAVGSVAYAVASRTKLTVHRACDDAAIGTAPLRDADAQALAFSGSGMLLLHRTAASATVFQLR